MVENHAFGKMMESGKTKLFFAAGAVLGAVFLLLVARYLLFGDRSLPPATPDNKSLPLRLSPRLPENAFLPVTEDESPITFLLGPFYPGPENPSSVISGSSSSYPRESKPRLLPLSNISDKDIRVSADGVRTVGQYVDYFALHSQEINFDSKRFNEIPRNEQGVILLPEELTAQLLVGKNSEPIRKALRAHGEFLSAEIKFLSDIKVYGEAIGLNKKMLGLNNLALKLISETDRFEREEITISALSKFLIDYAYTAEHYRQEFVETSGLFSSESLGFVSKKINDFLGSLTVYAQQGRPLGGRIDAVTSCTCEPVGSKVVINATRAGAASRFGGTIYFTNQYLASPLFYGARRLERDYYILALARPANPSFACLPKPKEICEEVTPPGSTSTVEECRIEMVCEGEVFEQVTISGTARP